MKDQERQSVEESVLQPEVETRGEAIDKPTVVRTTNRSETPDTPEMPLSLDNSLVGKKARSGFIAVLSNVDFLLLWSGQVFSQLADKVLLVLMVNLVTLRFQPPGDSVSGWVSGIMVAFTCPAILFGSLAGIYADRWPKQFILVGSNFLRGMLLLGTPFFINHSSANLKVSGIPIGFLILLAITFCVSTLTQFFAPAEQATIPLIVNKEDLLSANSLYTTTMVCSVIIGFAIGEPILTVADHLSEKTLPQAGSSILIGLIYIFSGLLLGLLRFPQENRSGVIPNVWGDLQTALNYLQERPLIRAAILQMISLYSVFAVLAVLAVRLAEMIPLLKTSQFGILLAAAGGGMVLGALLIGSRDTPVHHSQWGILGSLLMALLLIALASLSEFLWPTIGVISGIGFIGSLIAIPMQTLIQETTPAEMRGKVFGLENNLINIALSLPLALTGVLEAQIGVFQVLVGLAIITAVSGFFTWKSVDSTLEIDLSQRP
jgi:predicted MFS family arabinose efflux permease